MSRSSLIIDLQQRLCDPGLQFRLAIKFLDHPLGDLPQIHIDVVLDGDVDLRALAVEACKP
jgi:hypothetical protein